MADSNSTKQRIADGLKQLMDNKPFAKISVGDICENCSINRKSFYYHFRDKYDLVNWIFYTEFVHTLNYVSDDKGWIHLTEVCQYFYDNKRFYSKALKIEGQNSFQDYFREILETIVLEYMKQYFGSKSEADFAAEFFTDAIICTIIKWLTSKNPCSPKEITDKIHSCVKFVKPKPALEDL